ncbi:MAG: 16S rRNA (adenine(1518)-N(6)/adenine(1519)-N(6))-dimethyltransferase RsmA, partial [Patescibacteria group bacterium]
MNEIRNFCRQLNIIPSKKMGQNFLINKKILDDIIEAADLRSDDIVLEIGPGFGYLTEKLAQKAKKVIAVELDKRLFNYLKKKFANQKNIKIIQGDILKIENYKSKIKNFKVVANLPYNITGAVLWKFLSEKPKPNLMVLMLQKEVAERVVEKNNKSSIISLMVNFYGRPKIIRFVSKNNFWPRPKVDSAILQISQINKSRKLEEKKFFQLIKQGFSHPRKQLVNNLGKMIKNREKLKEILKKVNLRPDIRAEDLDLKKWLLLYYNLY